MGLNEEYDRDRLDQESRIDRWWAEVDRKRAKELRRIERKAMRKEAWRGWQLWDPRGWSSISCLVWGLIVVGTVWFWLLVYRQVRRYG